MTCYRCNKFSVPKSMSLCAKCKEEIIKELPLAEHIIALMVVLMVSVLVYFWPNG